MKVELVLKIELLQKETLDVYTWFESLTTDETLEVLENFVVQVRDNPEYAFVLFTKNALEELQETKSYEELFDLVNTSESNTFSQQIESHPLYKNTKLAFAYFYRSLIAFYTQYPESKTIKLLAQDFFDLQFCSGIIERTNWSDTDLLKDA